MALVALLILTVAFVRASGDPWPAPSACALPLPKSYVCYHLEKGEKIVVDGKLDEPAWKDVGWTLPFMGQCSHRKQSKPGVVTYNQYSMNYMDVHISISAAITVIWVLEDRMNCMLSSCRVQSL